MSMTRYLLQKCFVAVCAAGILCAMRSATVFSEPPVQKDILNDVNYYKKTSDAQNLDSNDRYYILLKLYDKYKNTPLDISPIENEIFKIKPDWQKVPEIQPGATLQTTVEVLDSTPAAVSASGAQNKDELSGSYRITQGDILKIAVSPAEELGREVVVRPDGMVELPLLGNVKLQGLTQKEASAFLEKGYSVYVTHPKVSVGIKYFSRQQIFLMGEVLRPGTYDYKDKMRLFELISSAGGLTQTANPKIIKVHRGDAQDRKTQTVNLDEVLKSGDLSRDFTLEPGDIVEVPKGVKTISVIGEIKAAGNVEWHEGMYVLDVISAAGGPTDLSSLGGTKLFRDEKGQRKTIKIELEKIVAGKTELDVKVQPGDIIFVPKKPLASGQWFVNTALPWLSLISLIVVIIAYRPK